MSFIYQLNVWRLKILHNCVSNWRGKTTLSCNISFPFY